MFQLTPNGLLDAFCMIAVYLLAIYNYACMKDRKRGTGFFFFVVFITLFSLFYRPEDGDFWHYLEAYRQGVDYPYHHMEDFYYWLMSLIPNNYLLWRVSIWLPTAIIICIIFKIMKIPSNNATTFFLLLALTNAFYYTRNALALSVLYLALVIFCVRNHVVKKTLNTVLFIALTFASWYLHKSMPVYILLALMAIILPFNKKYILASLIAFPLLYGVILSLTTNFVEIVQLWLMENAGDVYLEGENLFAANWKGVVGLIVGYLPIVYFYLIAFRRPLSKENPEFQSYKTFLLLSFFLFYISFLFSGQGSIAIQGRLYKSSMMPMAFVVCLFFKNNWGSKECRFFIFLMVLKITFSFIVGTASSI